HARADARGRRHGRLLPALAEVRVVILRLGARRDRSSADRDFRDERAADRGEGEHRAARLARAADHHDRLGEADRTGLARQPIPVEPDANGEVVSDRLERRASRRACRRARAARVVAGARETADPHSPSISHRLRAHGLRLDTATGEAAGTRHHSVNVKGGEGRRRAAQGLTLLTLATVACGHPRPVPPITDQQQSYGRFEPVVSYLQSQVDSAFPGAVVAVGYRDSVVLLAAVGHYGADDRRPVTTETVYDLASLTKVIGLTTAAMLLVDSGKLDLDAPVQRYVPAFQGPNKERVMIRHLLTHSSGLPAWRPLYAESADREHALALVDTTPLMRQPGDTFVYSDLGAMVLAQAVQAVSGQRLDDFLAARLFGPLGMTSTRYLPPESWRSRIAPTENDTVF